MHMLSWKITFGWKTTNNQVKKLGGGESNVTKLHVKIAYEQLECYWYNLVQSYSKTLPN